MRKKIWLIGGIMVLLSCLLPGCGESEPGEIKTMSEETSRAIGETTVYATVTRPESGQDLPAVVFIPGSGPTDRDWNSPLLPGTNGSAKLLAEELAREGYVTLRYDKRFTGAHAEENLPMLTGKISMQSHLEEVQAAVDMLRERDDVDKDRIFVLANSEGTLHAVNYQLQAGDKKFAGMILAGPPGQSVGDLARTQIAAQLAGMPDADNILEMYDAAVSDFVETGTTEPDEALPYSIKQFLLSLTNPVNMPFTQELWTADIVPELKNIHVPVLVIIGKKDIQIDWQLDGGNIQSATQGQENFSFAFPENANHVLKYEPKAREEINPASPNYNEADAVLDTGALEIIINWLDENS
jgi:pimeloyl-ACP methyl ester carboxylesterase